MGFFVGGLQLHGTLVFAIRYWSSSCFSGTFEDLG
jgi:hypothetical protein